MIRAALCRLWIPASPEQLSAIRAARSKHAILQALSRKEWACKDMALGNGKFGVAFALVLAATIAAGWWLGSHNRTQVGAPPESTTRDITAVPMAASPMGVSPAPASPPQPAPVTIFSAPPQITMGPFAPPVPDAQHMPGDTGSSMATDITRPGAEEGGQAPDLEAAVAIPAIAPAPTPPSALVAAPSAMRTLQPPGWARNAVASPANPDRLPVIAIVIDDLGVAPSRVAAALALPAPMTMAVLPYAGNAVQVAVAARAHGHEVLVHLPMEAENGQNPGPQALLGALTPQEFAQRVNWNLSRFDGYIGVNNHMGSKLTQNSAAMGMLMAQLKQRGLLFLDSRTAAGTIAAATARNIGVTSLQRDIFLDNVITVESVRSQLRKTEDTARRNGYAIAIGHPHPETIAALTAWAADIKGRGFLLAPLSTIARTGPSGKHVVSLPLPGG